MARKNSDYQIIQAMMLRGGSFVKALAEAFDKADGDNRIKIKMTWPELWKRYDELATIQAKLEEEKCHKL